MHNINVSVVYATKTKQWVYRAVVARGTSAQELIEMSDFFEQVPELLDTDINQLTIGVYADKIALDYLLEENDRVEIYRPLTADPKEVRRQLALIGKTMGSK